MSTSATLLSVLLAVTVVDGDTVEQNGIRYRLAGFDAPEIQHAKCPAERQAGIRAAARLIELLYLEHRLEETGRSGGFGRRVGRLWIKLDSPDVETDWATIAIREGHAVACTGRCPRKAHDWCKGA